jgi:acyl carrier protein
MKKSEFLKKLQDELELETELSLQSEFKKLPEWDSLTTLILIGFVENNFKVILSAKDFEGEWTVDALIKLIGEEKFQQG